MMTATKCPTADDLHAFSAGRLPEAENDSLFEHLRSCRDCQAELETIDDSADSLIVDLRTPDEFEQIVDEPQCNLALAKALATLVESGEQGPGKQGPEVQRTTDADSDPSSSGTPFPEKIGEYQLIRPIGRGGMGKVYLAMQTKLGRQVAIKVMASHRLADRRMRERFDAEMRAVGRLSHPNIVTAHDAREVDGAAVLITEYIDGYDLSEIIHRTGPLSIANATEIVRKVAAALQYVSDQGFVHRDVKPSNVMISRHGEVKLLDLGLARFESSDELLPNGGPALTGTGQAIGTPDYVAPEQVTDGRDVDHRTDIYSLGCTLFALLTGNAPFSDNEHQSAFAKMTAHVSKVPPSLADRLSVDSIESCPTALSQLVDLMLEKDPDRRPQSSGLVATNLAAWAHGHDLVELVGQVDEAEPQSRPLPAPSAARSMPWRRRTVTVPGVLLIGLVCGLIGLLMGMFIRIRYPDGTVVELPIGGAKVEFVELDQQEKRGSQQSFDRDASEDGVTNHSTMKSTREHDEKAFQASNEWLSKLQGIWIFRSYGDRRLAKPKAFFWALSGRHYYSVLVDNDGLQKTSTGRIDGINVGRAGSHLRVSDEEVGAGYSIEFSLSEGESLSFVFNPFRRKGRVPFQGNTDWNDRIDNRFHFDFYSAFSKYGTRPRLALNAIQANAFNALFKMKLDDTNNLYRTFGSRSESKFGHAETPVDIRSMPIVESSDGNAPGFQPKTPASTELEKAKAEPSLSKLQGIWRLSTYGASERDMPEVLLLGIHGKKIYSYVRSANKSAYGSIGDITGLYSPSGKLFLRVQERTKRIQLGFYCLFDGNGAMRFEFDPFANYDRLPFQNVANKIGGKVIYQFDRLGDFPLPGAKPLSLDRPTDETALSVLLQLKSAEAKKDSAFKDTGSKKTDESTTQNNLKQMGLAFHNYHATYRKFPGSLNTWEGAVGSGNGKLEPFSWRVAVLPFIEQKELFEQYRFDEPWDSESNLRLLEKMPAIYRSPHAPKDQPTGHTNYMGYASANGALEKVGGSSLREFRDGSSNTLLLIETKHTVPWTKPEDLDADVEVEFFDPTSYALADGSVKQVETLDPDQLRKLITRDGGERIR